MESFKLLDEITEPDIRNTFFAVTDKSTFTRELTIKDIHEAVSAITLNESVPEEIRSHFTQAQNLTVYSWFHYPFNVTAQFLGFVTVEFALKIRFQVPPKSRMSFKRLIRKAVNEGLVLDEGFAITAHRETSEKTYVETLIEVMPDLRNSLAHGSNMLHNSSLSSLRTCADFINQLFP